MRSEAPRDAARGGERGFTLIEVLIVVTIIGIIAGIAIPGLLTALDKAKQVSTSTLLRGFGEALEIYNSDNGQYPDVTTVQDLVPLLNPYSDSLRPYDEWKHNLSYQVNAALDLYSIESFGKDGIDGANVTPETRYVFTLDIVLSTGVFTAAIE